MFAFERDNVKKIIKEWILEINNKEKLLDNIQSLNFGLFEPYGVDLACEEDFVLNELCDLLCEFAFKWEDYIKFEIILDKRYKEF